MNCRVAFRMDIRIKRKTNQDGLLIKGAETEWGDVLLCSDVFRHAMAERENDDITAVLIRTQKEGAMPSFCIL